jgi:hypothetical protein
LSRVVKRAAYDYKQKIDGDKATDEEKQQLDKLINFADQVSKSLDNSLRLNAETKARAQRHPAGLNTENRVWMDDEGNRYQFDNNKAEYSEDEGLILHVNRLDTKPHVEEEQAISNLDKLINRYQEQKSKDPENADTYDNLINSARQQKEAL